MTAPSTYDALVIGAGLNGLVTANYLAKAGRKVLVLERRDRAGGQAASAHFADGTVFDPLHAGGRLRPDIVRDLGLERHGLTTNGIGAPPAYVSLLPDRTRLVLRGLGSDAETLASIATHSAKDAATWPQFVAFMDTAAAFLDAAYRTPMPRLPNVGVKDGLPLAKLAWKLRQLGGRDMFRVIRSLSMSTVELTEEWFESEQVKAAVAAVGIHGNTLGSMSAGTGYTLIHNWLNRGGLAHRPVAGGTVALADALVAELAARGGKLRLNADVARIRVEALGATGVELADGEFIPARTIHSALDPKRTLLGLVGAPELPPDFVWQVQSIKMRGSVAKVHLRTDGSHGLLAGTIAVAPTLKGLERAYDAAKYGELSATPYVEAMSAGDVVSLHVQFVPYKLKGGDWTAARAAVEQRALAALEAHFPSLRASIRETIVLLPPDLEATYGLTEGDLNHGQLILDQMMFLRPLPGWSDHRTPVDNLYLCGSGMHGGGGVSGAAGRNAAMATLAG
jgi:phytoene dehydrogenase-like protein